MLLTPTSRLRRTPGVEATTLGRELVLLDASGRTLRGLNGTGAFIWEALDGQKTLEEVARALAEQYQQAPDRVQPEVEAFVLDLLQKGLLTET